MSWSKAQHYCFDCLRTGCYLHRGEDPRFLTLTSAPGMTTKSLMRSFTLLKSRIGNLTPLKLIESGYVDGNRLNDFYPTTKLDDYLKFEYLCVRTSEGVCGVLHIYFFGDFIPTRWLWDTWKDITGVAESVKIKRVSSSDAVAEYMTDQRKVLDYVSGQSDYVRFSYSSGWVFRDFKKAYRVFKKSFWFNELGNVAVSRGLPKNLISLYRISKDLSNADWNNFFKKRWSKWLEHLDCLSC